MEEIFEKIGNCGVVPVAVLRDAGQACPLADALCEGGLPCAEVTFRTEAAPERSGSCGSTGRICLWEPGQS